MNTLEYINNLFDREAPRPPARELSLAVSTAIGDGVLQPGDALPTERAFCEALGLPRSVVREALTILSNTGTITRVAGLGTFVSPAYMRRQLDSVYDFTSAVEGAGMDPSTEVVAVERTTAAGFSSYTLDLPKDDLSIFRIERIRYADDVAMALEFEHIPCGRFPDLDKEDLTGSLYRVLSEHYGVEIGDADEYYQAVLLGKHEAQLLGRQHRSPAFRIVRVVRDTEGRVFSVTEAFVPGDHTRLGVHLVGRTSRNPVHPKPNGRA